MLVFLYHPTPNPAASKSDCRGSSLIQIFRKGGSFGANTGSRAAIAFAISGRVRDYKPGAKTDEPIELLTIYALALSRLTGLRLMDFKCAWFDGDHFYEFYPLHVVQRFRYCNGIATEVRTTIVRRSAD